MKKNLFLVFLLLGFCFVVQAQGNPANEKFPFVGKITASDVNVRSGAHLNFEVVGKVKKERKVVVIEKKDSWYKIRMPKNLSVYVNAKFVNSDSDFSGVIRTDRVNVRAKPDINSTIITQFNKGEVVRIRSKSKDWLKIIPNNNCFAWANENFISFVEPFIGEKVFENIISPKVKTIKTTLKKQLVPIESKQILPVAEGILEDSGRIINKKPFHKLTDDTGKTTYYLTGDKKLLDTYSNCRVAVWGEISSENGITAPIVNVQKILIIE